MYRIAVAATIIMGVAIAAGAGAETVDEFIERVEASYVDVVGSTYTCSNCHISLALTSDGVAHGGFVFGGPCELARYAVVMWERHCQRPYTSRNVCGWFFYNSLEDEIAFHCQGWTALALASAGLNVLFPHPFSTVLNAVAIYWQTRANPIDMGPRDTPPDWQPPS